MRTITRILAVAGTFLGILLSGSVSAQVLYGADGGGGNPACRLYTINPATGAIATNIGAIGFAVTGLAVHPVTGVLYGSTGGASPVSPNSIITINTTTGAGTLVGATGLGGPVADITFRSDGVLFGWSEGSDDLVTINLATGVGTIVGPSALNTFGSGIAMSPANVLFFAGTGASGPLYTLNQATGADTAGPNISGAPNPGSAISAMAFNPAGVLFAVNLAGATSNLITINTTTAVATNVGVSVNALDAIAFAPAALPVGGGTIPTMSEWMLVLLALMLLGSVALGRKRAKVRR